jgi:uncharacterized protein
MKKITVFALTLVLSSIWLYGGMIDVPYLTGRVNDEAQILSESTIKTLSETLKQHEEKTTNQVVVLTVPSLEGDNIEDYANRVFNEWKLGQKGKDNGILVVVVPGDRKMRIEVGYGLEGELPDVLAGRIIRNIMTPLFRQEDYDGGIVSGVDAIIDVLEGRELAEDSFSGSEGKAEAGNGLSDFEQPDMPITLRILIGAFIFGILGLFTILGIMTPGFGWFLYLFLIPFWAMFPIMVLGTKGALVCFIIYLVIYPSAKIYLKHTDWYKKAKEDLRTKGKASIGGFSFSTGGSGGSWSSGGSSSGGFSGGGGSSGGGGASGGW